MTHGIPDSERLQDLLDRMNYALSDVQELDRKIQELGFERVAAYSKWRNLATEYETFKSALAGERTN